MLIVYIYLNITVHARLNETNRGVPRHFLIASPDGCATVSAPKGPGLGGRGMRNLKLNENSPIFLLKSMNEPC